MRNKNLITFKKKVNAKNIPFDLEMWVTNKNNCNELFTELGFTLLKDNEFRTILNPNQLDFKDEASYFAIKNVLKKIVLVAKNDKDEYYGYSLYNSKSLIDAPIVSYDKEGFCLEYGNITQAFLIDLVKEDENKFNIHKKTFEKYGINLGNMKVIIENSDKLHEKYIEPDDLRYDLVEEFTKGRDISHLKFNITNEEFLEWRKPRYGTENPTIINSKVWRSIIAIKEDAYSINKKHNGPSSFGNGPVWCFSRLGQSLTRVNGKEIFIAGEHEDYYDPDFYIYNDVVVVNKDDSIDIYNYPKDVFPSTDFHSATLINKKTILIIGSLGYVRNRKTGFTQVFTLNINNFKINKKETFGENPGWIHLHRTILSENKKSITITGGEIDTGTHVLENLDEWQLDLQTFEWKRLTHNKWERWKIERKDGKGNHIWDIRQALFSLNANGDDYGNKNEKLIKKLDYIIDVSEAEQLYQFNDIPSFKELPESDEYNIFKISIDDVIIKFKETFYCIEVTIEGTLDFKIIEMVKNKTLKRVSKLENSEFKLIELTK